MDEKYEILKQIEQEEETLIVDIITDDMKKRVLEIEMERLDELIPFINEGINTAFNEENVAIIIRDLNKKQREMIDAPTLLLLTESGKIIGEEIYDEEELEELRERNDVYFVSENFVTYTNMGTNKGEKQFFKLSSTNSSFFTDCDLNKYVISLSVAIPSTNTDHYLREYYGYTPNDNISTLLLGFTI